MASEKTPSGWQSFGLFALRALIGWHFLYEGLAKLWTPGWTAAGYLSASRWVLADAFHWITTDAARMRWIDTAVVWALMVVGLCLMLGWFTRIACLMAGGLLISFYVCNPPLPGLSIPAATEGSYLVINKNIVELAAIALLLVFDAGRHWGIDGIIVRPPRRDADDDRGAGSRDRETVSGTRADEPLPAESRRAWLKGLAGIPVLAGFGLAAGRQRRWDSYEEANLVDGMSAASSKTLHVTSLAELKGELPRGRIGDCTFSRVILGGNLISGWAHSRDLIYVSSLVKAYHTKQKVFETLLLAENCGINTLLTNPIICTLIDEYWKRGIGKIQFISDCAGMVYTDGKHAMPFDEYLDKIRRAIDYGACACYIQGETADFYIEHGHLDRLIRAIELIEDSGIPVGIGAHRIETIKACVDAGLDPDFWMKTLHHHQYWSARHPEWKDNMYCYSPQETIAYMETLRQPWIAFKVLAAGAIRPHEGFRYAFSGGADYVCVGMYDFQMVNNVNTALDVLGSDLGRRRPWCGELSSRDS